MTVIKLHSNRDSFRSFAERCPLKDVKALEKGEVLSSRRVRDEYRLNIGFSRKDWDDLPGQVRDAKQFLKKHGGWIRQAMRGRKITSAYIDFPVDCRLNEKIAVQQDFFDSELLELCGRYGLGINLANYGCEFTRQGIRKKINGELRAWDLILGNTKRHLTARKSHR